MTEKRFIYIEHKGADYILDTPKWHLDFIEMLGDCLESEEIVDLLNDQDERVKELAKENRKLKREVKRLKCINKQLEERLDKDIALDMDCGDVE